MRQLLAWLLLVVLAVAGCARQAPQQGPSTAGSGAAVPPVVVGTTDDPTVQVLAELYAQGLAVKGRVARIATVESDTTSQVARLQAGDVDLVAGFAWTAVQGLNVDAHEAETLVSDLAAALEGEVVVLQPSRIDRAWRFVAPSGGSLAKLPRGVHLVAPARWQAAPDGLSGLEAVYGAKPALTVVDNPVDRLKQVQSGAIGVFDGTEPQGADASVKVLEDPRLMISTDPHIALLRIELSADDTVLDVVQQLHEQLDNAAIAELRTKLQSGTVTAAVEEWLTAHPLR